MNHSLFTSSRQALTLVSGCLAGILGKLKRLFEDLLALLQTVPFASNLEFFESQHKRHISQERYNTEILCTLLGSLMYSS